MEIKTIKVKGVVLEDFVNYKKPSMFVGVHKCDWKCCKEQNLPLTTCQNNSLHETKTQELDIKDLINKYLANPITEAIVVGGLEPIINFEEVLELLKELRSRDCNDDFVVYTGYYPDEILQELELIKQFQNVYFKFGRYMPNKEARYDEVLGVTLASSNQYGQKIS